MIKNWQERCAEVIEFLEGHFPDVQYRITLRKTKGEGWILIVESVRKDGGAHTGTAADWLRITAADVEELPARMLRKAKERVLDWQNDGLERVRKQAEELQKARNELDKRLDVNRTLEHLAKAVESAP